MRYILISFLFTLAIYAYESSLQRQIVLLEKQDAQFLSMLKSERLKMLERKRALLIQKKLNFALKNEKSLLALRLKTLVNVSMHHIATLMDKEKKRKAKTKYIEKRKRNFLLAKIDISKQRMKVYKGGELIYTWKTSTGKKGYATPRGNYKVQWTSKNYRSRKYNNAPMPYSVFFKNGYAIHGTRSVNRLGRRASHGCVRLHTKNAKKFFALVNNTDKSNTSIRISY